MSREQGIEKTEIITFTVEGDDLGSLLFNFLDELLYHHEVELLVFSGFDIELDPLNYKLKAVCHGERFDLEKHSQGIAIKAVTFHNMRIEKEDNAWTILVVLDT